VGTSAVRPIRSALVADCLFCRLVAGEVPSARVVETDTTLAFRDINPQAPVHVLVIPKDHVSHVQAVTADHGALLGELFATIREVAVAEGLADQGGTGEPAYRVVANVGAAAGMSVPHLHFHVLGGRRLAWPPG
jgi:histidine triad (HIT) family protein